MRLSYLNLSHLDAYLVVICWSYDYLGLRMVDPIKELVSLCIEWKLSC